MSRMGQGTFARDFSGDPANCIADEERRSVLSITRLSTRHCA